MKYFNSFLNNKKGALAIEFAFCFLLFMLILFIIYDAYSTIILQAKLERTNYTVATVFRERSTLYKDKVKTAADVFAAGLCSDRRSCYYSYEVFDSQQVDEMTELASSLLNNRQVYLRIEALFMLQHPCYPGDMTRARLVTQGKNILSCSSGTCSNNSIKNYFNGLLAMDEPSNNYQQLAPYAQRLADSSTTLTGRWIPIYRVSMCIANEESFYLKWLNSNRRQDGFMPSLCSNVVVISRCNDANSCPAYY